IIITLSTMSTNESDYTAVDVPENGERLCFAISPEGDFVVDFGKIPTYNNLL
ncbi:1347_t:CDS:1, partial [Racocetra fulgida]